MAVRECVYHVEFFVVMSTGLSWAELICELLGMHSVYDVCEDCQRQIVLCELCTCGVLVVLCVSYTLASLVCVVYCRSLRVMSSVQHTCTVRVVGLSGVRLLDPFERFVYAFLAVVECVCSASAHLQHACTACLLVPMAASMYLAAELLLKLLRPGKFQLCWMLWQHCRSGWVVCTGLSWLVPMTD
jgi:hypothetical protein